MNVVVTGSLAYDYIMDFPGRFADRIMPDKIHKISLSFLVDRLDKQFGGTAGNIAYTLKLLGIEPLILSSAGNDFASYKAHLHHYDISINYIREYSKVSTGSYFGVTDQDDNQIGAFYEGPMKYNSKLHLSQIKEKVDLVIIGPHDPKAMSQHVSQCKTLNLPYLYDPAFQIDHFSAQELLSGIKGATILFGNDYEIALIEKKLGIGHSDLLKLTPIVVTTLGSKGSVVESNGSSFWGSARWRRLQNPDSGSRLDRGPMTLDESRVSRLSRRFSTKSEQARMTDKDKVRIQITAAKPKNASDPTGAGDAYRAGFIAGYLRRFDLKTCAQMGSVAAVYTVEKYGTQTHHFTIEDFVKRYKSNYSDSLRL